jgi:hypothetical protein
VKRIHYSLFVVILAWGGCKQAGQIKQPEALTEQQVQIITKEVTKVMNATVKGINQLNADSVFKDMSKVTFSRYINNGIIFNDYDSTYTTFKNIYCKLKKLNVALTNEKYTVLSLNSVLFTAGFRVVSLDMNDCQSQYQGAMTCAFQKTGEKWKVIHVHESLFPVNNKK